MDAEFIISIGLNDQITHRQEVKTADARKMVFEAFGDCTVQTCKGKFTHESGVVVYENSLRIFVYGDHTDRERLAAICRGLKIKLNQESIVLSWRPCGETDFI